MTKFKKMSLLCGQVLQLFPIHDQTKLTKKIEPLETLKLEQIFQMQSTLNAYHGK